MSFIRSEEQKPIVLVLQGGGALGAYQAGVYDALSRSHFSPRWVAGISIGAINAALIVGNRPEDRVHKLRTFWETVSSHLTLPRPGEQSLRNAYNWSSAMVSATAGVPGFYRPFSAWDMWTQPEREHNSIYDASPLRDTLASLVDFDLINRGDVRLSVGAVNVCTGNSEYFDSAEQEIRVEHILASGALPPAFAPIEIDGEYYWDGGIVSNTPLTYVLDRPDEHDQTILQVDLFSARGDYPVNMAQVSSRHKDIMYSSRTRFNTDMISRLQNMHKSVHELLALIPPEQQDHPVVKQARQASQINHTNIIHLIYRPRRQLLDSKDYEFSRVSIDSRWKSGFRDMTNSLSHPDWLSPTSKNFAVTTYDLARPAE